MTCWETMAKVDVYEHGGFIRVRYFLCDSCLCDHKKGYSKWSDMPSESNLRFYVWVRIQWRQCFVFNVSCVCVVCLTMMCGCVCAPREHLLEWSLYRALQRVVEFVLQARSGDLNGRDLGILNDRQKVDGESTIGYQHLFGLRDSMKTTDFGKNIIVGEES